MTDVNILSTVLAVMVGVIFAGTLSIIAKLNRIADAIERRNR